MSQREKIDKINSEIEKAENEYHQTIEEYLEFYHRYNETNQMIKLSNQEMETLRNHLLDYEQIILNKYYHYLIKSN